MIEKKNKHPSCFGILEFVFPVEANGFRNTPVVCLSCSFKTKCLKTALAGSGGLKIQEDLVDRAYESGMIGFLERWSKKKGIQRRKNNQ